MFSVHGTDTLPVRHLDSVLCGIPLTDDSITRSDTPITDRIVSTDVALSTSSVRKDATDKIETVHVYTATTDV
jgi:hypothetical protein